MKTTEDLAVEIASKFATIQRRDLRRIETTSILAVTRASSIASS